MPAADRWIQAESDRLVAVSVDAEGYGFPEHQRTLARLMEDIRILSPAGVERAAQGWDRHARLHGLQAIHDAEKAAIHAIEKADRGSAWDEVRRNLFGLTESGQALVSWKAEHGEIGHKEEEAKTLLRPLSEALPWLLPDENQPVA